MNLLLKANPRVQSRQGPKMGKHCYVNASCEGHEKLPSHPKVTRSSAWLFLLGMSRHIWTPYPPALQVIDNSESTQRNGKGWESAGGGGGPHPHSGRMKPQTQLDSTVQAGFEVT